MKIRALTLTAIASAALAFTAPAFAQSAAQAAYDAQMRDYQRQQEEYRAARDQYNADVDAYNNPRIYNNNYARATYRPYESLTSVSDQILNGKPVETRDGQYVGRIRDSHIMGSLVTQVEVLLPNGGVTWVNSSRVRYDEDANVVVTDLSADQMYGRARIDF